jgi:formiminotetrahydrofolate cyclodeaminase
MNKIPLTTYSVTKYLKAVAGKTQTPGGGSCSALVGAVGVALLEMSMAYSGFAPRQISQIRKIRQKLVKLIDEDARAYSKVLLAWKKGERRQKQKALKNAAGVSLEICRHCTRAINFAKGHHRSVKAALMSDWKGGQYFLKAAFLTSSLNVKQNLNE